MSDPTEEDLAVEDVTVIEMPEGIRVYTEDDEDLVLPEADQTGDHVRGGGAL